MAKKKKKRASGRLLLFAVLAVVIAGGIWALTSGGGEKGNTPGPAPTLPGEDPYAEDDDDSTYREVSQDDLVDVTDLSVYEGLDETWRNILLIGQDTRTFDSWGRGDTLIICSVNTVTGAVKMCSILRDTWVDIPEVGPERINTSYQFGGPRLAMKTVNELFHLNITEYVAVNFSSFPHIIDAIGGVEIDVKPEEVPHINYGVGSSIWQGQHLGLDESDLDDSMLPEDAEGIYNLTGRQALAYARIRKLDSDFVRTSRQRMVISAAMIKFRGTTDAMVLLNLGTKLVNYVQTNMDVMTMVGLAVPVLKSGVNNISEMRIPLNDSYVYESRNFIEAFYDLDLEANRAALHQFIYGG